jgi:ActR/RegA family two-component response regulator
VEADPVDLQLLAPVLRLVARAAGLAAALRLVELKGGVHVYVPKDADPGHPLASIITEPGLAALCQAYGGEHLLVPMARAALLEMRNRKLRAARGELSVHQLAREFGLHRRRVQQILAEDCGQQDAEAPDLFA